MKGTVLRHFIEQFGSVSWNDHCVWLVFNDMVVIVRYFSKKSIPTNPLSSVFFFEIYSNLPR